jgi:hypothetical protein
MVEVGGLHDGNTAHIPLPHKIAFIRKQIQNLSMPDKFR